MEEAKKVVKGARQIYMNLLIAALVLYIIGSAFTLSDLYRKVGEMEHKLVHITCDHK